MLLSFTKKRQIYESLAIMPLKTEAIIPSARVMVQLTQEIKVEDEGRKKLLHDIVGPDATQISDTHPRFMEWAHAATKLRETESEVEISLTIEISDIELNRAPAGIQEHIARLAGFGFINLDPKDKK